MKQHANNEEVYINVGKKKIIKLNPMIVNNLGSQMLLIFLLPKVKSIIHNVRGVGFLPSRDRMKNLCMIHNINVLVLLETLISSSKLDLTSIYLGF